MKTVFVVQAEIFHKDTILEQHLPEVYVSRDDAIKYISETYPGLVEIKYYANVAYQAEVVAAGEITTRVVVHERNVN